MNGQTYCWRVRPKNGSVLGQFSEVWNFTCIGLVPSQVVLVSLSDGVSHSADTALFAWRESQPDVDRYWFEIAPDSEFVFSLVDSAITDTSTVVRVLQDGKQYWWRAKAHNGEGWGPFSEIRSFSVILTGVEGDGVLPGRYSLAQNFPNPFNPSTVIEFRLPEATHVRLDIFSILGERVATLVDEMRHAGVYQERFNAESLPSGTYVYRLTTLNGSFVKKMMLLK